MESADRRRLLARIDELLGDPGGGEVRTVDGWEGWFVQPGYAPPAPPRRWKMAAITLAALYPLVLAWSGRFDRSPRTGRSRSGSS
jgi:uncharacterized protein